MYEDDPHLQSLEERVRELEKTLRADQKFTLELQQRIDKAKAILESSDGMTQKMKDALAALEGK